jgi:hypothetical protein
MNHKCFDPNILCNRGWSFTSGQVLATESQTFKGIFETQFIIIVGLVVMFAAEN